MTHSPIVALRRRISTKQVSLGRLMPVLLSALALVTAGPAAWASASTTTSLFTTPDNPSSGAVITMTAQVESTEFTVAGGTVTFVDTYNGQSEVLATVQVQSTNGNPGTAVLATEVGGVGIHQFVATYNGTSTPNLAASSSSSQSVTFVAPYLTATALTSTGTSPNATRSQELYRRSVRWLPPAVSPLRIQPRAQPWAPQPSTPPPWRDRFTPFQNYPIANMDNGQTGSTIGPAIGDFNGDGRPDYAVPVNSGSVFILLGKGDGTFTNGTTITTTSPFEPTSVVVGDFNGDGNQDLAVLSANGIGSVNIYLGKGDGTFQAAKNFKVATANSASRLLAIGDFNRDGIEDLVATNSSLNQVAVILGNGDGTFKQFNVTKHSGNRFCTVECCGWGSQQRWIPGPGRGLGRYRFGHHSSG